MRILCVFGRSQYGDASRGTSTEYTAFYETYAELGYEVSIFDTWVKSEITYDELNHRFIQFVIDTAPDLIFWVPLQHDLYTETLDLVRHRLGTPVVMWGTDDSWKHWQQTRILAKYVDLAVTTWGPVAKLYVRNGINCHHASWGTPRSWISTTPRLAGWKHSVSFVGTATPYRRSFIKSLRLLKVDVRTFGHGWDEGPVSIEEIPEIMSDSYITLNFSDSGSGRQTKARVFEATGCGTCLLTESSPDLTDFFVTNDELVTFSNPKECKKKIDYLLRNPETRNLTAIKGLKKTSSRYTYSQICREILQRSAKLNSTYRNNKTHAEHFEEARKFMAELSEQRLNGKVSSWMSTLAKDAVICRRFFKGLRRILIYLMVTVSPNSAYSRKSILNLFYRGL